jgi:hypothetical protein
MKAIIQRFRCWLGFHAWSPALDRWPEGWICLGCKRTA